MHRAVHSWMQLTQEAILYGVEEQMIKGRKPILSALQQYKPYRPKGALEKSLLDLRVIDFAESLGKAGPIKDVTASLADWHCLRMKGDQKIGRMHLRIYGDAMGQAGQVAWVSFGFDVVNRRAVAWAAKNTNKLVTNILEETREALRGVISRGIADGQSMPTIGRTIRGLAGPKGQSMIGLNSRQAFALEKYEARLVERYGAMRGGLTPARQTKVSRAIARERRRKLRYRTEMISRSETARAVSEGTLEGYKEAGVKQIRFLASADACIVCTGYDGDTYNRSEGEGLIPVHPNCRCTWLPVIKL